MSAAPPDDNKPASRPRMTRKSLLTRPSEPAPPRHPRNVTRDGRLVGRNQARASGKDGGAGSAPRPGLCCLASFSANHSTYYTARQASVQPLALATSMFGVLYFVIQLPIQAPLRLPTGCQNRSLLKRGSGPILLIHNPRLPRPDRFVSQLRSPLSYIIILMAELNGKRIRYDTRRQPPALTSEIVATLIRVYRS